MFELILDFAVIWLVILMGTAALALASARETPRRLVLVDLATLLLVAVLVLTSISREERYYLDAALALSLLSFVGSVVIAFWAATRQGSEASR